MARDYHNGELAVQQRAGVLPQAGRIAGAIHDSLSALAQAFLEQRSFVVLSTADVQGRPWASIVSGPPGFTQALDPRTIRIATAPAPDDPLAQNLGVSRLAALLAIDFAGRRRLRFNGHLELERNGSFLIHADQVYSNCQKYIQRHAEADSAPFGQSRLLQRAHGLTDEQRAWIRRTDTFFLATLNPGEGADISHRGGSPGFLSIKGDRLTWPDYAGNTMFNTLGNIEAYPRAGLLIPDFSSGTILQLTGRAVIDWDSDRAAAVPGAERLVELVVEEILERR
jgi:uncharacterized protein